mmetsp:Transcript_71554/g.165478  ORF Transcript_71554/g.165478 Transcript_71554/m.165478 type:complete len:112 (-) Transcript_71554:950-1285(-)
MPGDASECLISRAQNSQGKKDPADSMSADKPGSQSPQRAFFDNPGRFIIELLQAKANTGLSGQRGLGSCASRASSGQRERRGRFTRPLQRTRNDRTRSEGSSCKEASGQRR